MRDKLCVMSGAEFFLFAQNENLAALNLLYGGFIFSDGKKSIKTETTLAFKLIVLGQHESSWILPQRG